MTPAPVGRHAGAGSRVVVYFLWQRRRAANRGAAPPERAAEVEFWSAGQLMNSS